MSGPSVQKSVRISLQDDQFMRDNNIVFAKLVKRAISDLRVEIEFRNIEDQNEAKNESRVIGSIHLPKISAREPSSRKTVVAGKRK